jgi:ribosomal protein L44E
LIQIPFVAVRVLIVEFVDSWPDLLAKMKNMNGLDFNCTECGELDRNLVFYTYDPRKNPVTERLRFCPSCQRGTEVRVSFDPEKKIRKFHDLDHEIAKEFGVKLDEFWE